MEMMGMSTEWLSITVLAMMLFGLIALQGAMVPMHQGFGWGLGSRDEPREFTAFQKRLGRMVANQVEGNLIYTPLMLAAIALGRTSELTALAAWLVIGGRALFILFYATGTFALRSLSFLAFLIGVFITIAQLF